MSERRLYSFKQVVVMLLRGIFEVRLLIVLPPLLNKAVQRYGVINVLLLSALLLEQNPLSGYLLLLLPLGHVRVEVYCASLVAADLGFGVKAVRYPYPCAVAADLNVSHSLILS